jgi:hypothetical protein
MSHSLVSGEIGAGTDDLIVHPLSKAPGDDPTPSAHELSGQGADSLAPIRESLAAF